MKLIDVNIDGQVFKVQEGMSFVQQNKLMELIEDFIDFTKLESIQNEVEDGTLTIEKFATVLQEGVKLTSFTFGLSEFCLCNFVKEPLITKEILNDPDAENIDDYVVLGSKLVELALTHISKRSLLKKTPTI